MSMMDRWNYQISRRAFVAGLALTPLALTACSSAGTESTGSTAQTSQTAAEGLTMLTASMNYQKFSEGVTAKYPDTKLSMISYSGYDTSDYIKVQMQAQACPDIVINTFPNSNELQKDNLIDLSSKDFVNNVRTKLLDDVAVDGAIYLLPSNVSFFGPYYNKTLFEKNGWSAPESLDELEELVPKIKEAGVTVSEVTSTLPGSSFAFFWDIIAPEFTSTLDGINWRNDFLEGKANATGTLEPYMETLQKWVDLGMFNIDPNMAEDKEAIARFKEGNTAFLTTVSNQAFTQNEDGTGDEYRIMPWLSKDGSNNIIITNVHRYYGLNKDLEKDSKKLDAAYDLMEYLSSVEGQEALLTNSNTISPLKNAAVAEDNPLHEAAELVDAGKSMNMVYSGWENYVALIGADVFQFLQGKMDAATVLKNMDDLRDETLAAGGTEVLGKCDETLELEQVATLVGAAFADAAGADCALISIGGFHDFGKENSAGINGKIYKDIDIDANVVCTFNPLGWKQLIKTGELTGEQINKWIEEGYFNGTDTEPFEYKLIMKDGEKIDTSKTYKVALVNESDARASECNMQKTELVGQDVLKAYIQKLGTINSKSIVWK